MISGGLDNLFLRADHYIANLTKWARLTGMMKVTEKIKNLKTRFISLAHTNRKKKKHRFDHAPNWYYGLAVVAELTMS